LASSTQEYCFHKPAASRNVGRPLSADSPEPESTTTLSAMYCGRCRRGVGVEVHLAALEHGLQALDDFLAPAARPVGHLRHPVMFTRDVNLVFAATDVVEQQFDRFDFAFVQFFV